MIDEGEIDLDAFLHTRVGEMLHDPATIGLVGEFSPEHGPVILRARVLDVGQELTPFPHEVQAPTDQIARGPHRGGIDVRLRQQPTAE